MDHAFADADAALRRHFGHPAFRPPQERVVRACLAGRDVLGVLPTGAGKSVCFQIPALLDPRPTLVVSPLIALMADQVAGARRRGIPAAAWTSGLSPREREALVDRLRGGALRLLYVSPERLASRRFLAALDGVRMARLVVDEAHCITEWGHDFRPAYRRIGAFHGRVGAPPLTALTATATPRTRRDIERALGMRRPARVLARVDRPNLRWSARRARGFGEGYGLARRWLRGLPGQALLYLPTRARTVSAARALRRDGIPAAAYHAGLPPERRSRVQDAFLAEELRVVCATSAFGMGVDHPRIRGVVHLGLPPSLEAYVQEAGRAGRDGGPAECALVGLAGDRALRRRLAARSWPSPRQVRLVWRSCPAGRPVDVEACRRRAGRRLGRRLDPATVEAAFRLLVEFGAARAVSSGERRQAIVRAPDALRGRIDLGTIRRGRARTLERFRAVEEYVETTACRRARVAAYFEEPAPPCAGCDNCGYSGRRFEASISISSSATSRR